MKPDFATLAGELHKRQLERRTDNGLKQAERNPFKGTRVLVVDDDPTQRLLARDALEAHGFVVEEASDGPEGIVKALVVKPDLIILDILMPVLDGFTVCSELRNHKMARNIPILIVTGIDDPDAIERGFQLGAADFISKPVNWQSLPVRVKFILRGRSFANMSPAI